MAERPGTSDGRSRVSMLAERFGMTNEEVEELLRSTREEYSAKSPAFQQAAEAVSQTAPEAVAAKPSGSFSGPPVSGVFLAVLFTILLIALGIALSLQQGWFRQRGDKQPTARVDTIQKVQPQAAESATAPPEKPSLVPQGELPPESLTGSQKIYRHVTRRAHPALTTSSSFEAEEELADLRAEGNDKSHIKSTRKGGSIKFQVFAK